MREKGRKKEKQTNFNDKDGRVECKKYEKRKEEFC